jgi:hypothetical protein
MAAAPWRAISTAIARPIPCPAPVINPILPSTMGGSISMK